MTETTNTAAVLTTTELLDRIRVAIGSESSLYSTLPKAVVDILASACATASLQSERSTLTTALYDTIIQTTEVG